MSATAENSQGVTNPPDAALTITDDDGPPRVTLHLAPPSISEVNGVSAVTASLDRASSAATTVTVAVAPVPPTVAGDYRLGSNRVLTIAAGATTSTGDVTVTASEQRRGRAGQGGDGVGHGGEQPGRDGAGPGDADAQGQRRDADGDAAPFGGFHLGGRRDEHGDGKSEPPVERGDDGDGVGRAGVAGGCGRLRAERHGADDCGGRDDEHRRGDDRGRGQRHGRARQDGDGFGSGDERPGSHGPAGRDADDRRRRQPADGDGCGGEGHGHGRRGRGLCPDAVRGRVERVGGVVHGDGRRHGADRRCATDRPDLPGPTRSRRA